MTWHTLNTHFQRLTDPIHASDTLRRKRMLEGTGWLLVGLTLLQMLLPFVVGDPARRIPLIIYGMISLVIAGGTLILARVTDNTWLPGGFFAFGLALLIACTEYPEGITEERALFFFSVPILFASVTIHPRASFWVAGYCGLLLLLVPVPAIGWAAAWYAYHSPALLGFFALAAFAWWVTQTLEQALTRQREANAQLLALIEQHEQLRRLDEEKDQLLFTVSHELRSPMTAIRLTLKQIVGGNTPDDKLHLVRREIDRLTDLVQDLLNLARLEHQPPQMEPVDLNQVITDVCATLQAPATAKGLVLAFEPAPDLPALQGHPAQLMQVVHNLVGNAINYTERGQVQVCTRLLPAPPRIALEVTDTGVGIEPEDLAHIFERMFRGSRTSGVPGTGLGLAIVQMIVTHHQGEITVQSTPGTGSIFTVLFPVWTAD